MSSQPTIIFIVFSIGVVSAAYSLLLPPVDGSGISVYTEDDVPFNVTHEEWVAKYWVWDSTIPLDQETGKFAGLVDGGCLMHEESSVIMLVDTAAGGDINQVCKIPAGRGILIPIWTGECSHADKNFETASFDKLAECAGQMDLGQVTGQVKVDGALISNLEATDLLTSNSSSNIIEVKASKFNITFPEGTHMLTDKYGTFPAVAHGWFVFLKPLPPGDHVVYYENTVTDPSLEVGKNVNNARITYKLTVEGGTT